MSSIRLFGDDLRLTELVFVDRAKGLAQLTEYVKDHGIIRGRRCSGGFVAVKNWAILACNAFFNKS